MKFSTTHRKQTASFKIAGSMLAIAPLGLMLALANTSAHAQTFTVLYQFGQPGGPAYAGTASSIIAQGRDGDLYTTSAGLAHKFTPTGAITILATTDPYPFSGLTLGTDGNYYGTTNGPGTAEGLGSVFKMTANGNVTTLYNFDPASGEYPNAPPIEGFDGNFYGTTSAGGSIGNNGTVYRTTSAGGFTNLHRLGENQGDCNWAAYLFATFGCPNGPLVQGRDGYLYGTTYFGGTNGQGSVFKISYSGAFTTLYSFDVTHGSYPLGPMVQGNDGNFYGTTTEGGLGYGYGMIFKITPAGALTVLHAFNGDSDGYVPFAGLIQASDGNLYGTTFAGGALHGGTLYRISPAGVFTVVHNFDPAIVSFPQTTPVQHTNGKLYGETSAETCWAAILMNARPHPFTVSILA
jgi:uncharacterized repeat protein (TIGR03803 family)